MRSAADAAPSYLYVPDLPAAGGVIELPAEESRYLRRVCRAKVGDLATATDGRGREARVRVTAFGRHATVVVESARQAPRTHQAWVLCGAPEGQRADWLIEKLGELGVSVFQPLDCARGAWASTAGRWERCRRLAIAALRQSRQAWLMDTRPASGLGEVVERLPGDARRWVALADGKGRLDGGAPETLEVVAVGPAGGFDGAETDSLIARGFTPIRLAETRLRTETAAIAWAAGWAARLP